VKRRWPTGPARQEATYLIMNGFIVKSCGRLSANCDQLSSAAVVAEPKITVEMLPRKMSRRQTLGHIWSELKLLFFRRPWCFCRNRGSLAVPFSSALRACGGKSAPLLMTTTGGTRGKGGALSISATLASMSMRSNVGSFANCGSELSRPDLTERGDEKSRQRGLFPPPTSC